MSLRSATFVPRGAYKDALDRAAKSLLKVKTLATKQASYDGKVPKRDQVEATSRSGRLP